MKECPSVLLLATRKYVVSFAALFFVLFQQVSMVSSYLFFFLFQQIALNWPTTAQEAAPDVLSEKGSVHFHFKDSHLALELNRKKSGFLYFLLCGMWN